MDGLDNYHDLWEEYRSYIEQHLSRGDSEEEEDNTPGVPAYLSEIGELLGNYHVCQQIEREDSDSSIDDYTNQIFFRGQPYEGQDLVVASINPGMNYEQGAFNSGDDVSEMGRYYRLNNASLEEQVHLCRDFLMEYLDHPDYVDDDDSEDRDQSEIGGWNAVFKSIDSSEYVSEQLIDSESIFDTDRGVVKDTLFEEIQWTQSFKLASPDKGAVLGGETKAEKFVKKHFPEELGRADPELLIVAGAWPWRALYEVYDENDADSDVVVTTVGDECAEWTSNYSRGSAPGNLYRFKGTERSEVPDNLVFETDTWVVTISHAGYYDPDDLDKNLEHICKEERSR